MTSRSGGASSAGGRAAGGQAGLAERVRRLTGLPAEVAGLSEELLGLRSDVAALRQDVLDLRDRLPAPGGSFEADEPDRLEESPFDDGIELFAERIATLEDGLDDVAQRLEGTTRDGISQLTGQIEQLTRRMDDLAARPSITQEQLEEALTRVAGLTRSSSS